ncbi:hypothetical protein WCD74_22015 [Actinomycetospora sp. OC33-EN08]|uniref:Uncharacterized protein n=1 Tax=Actinomycetospora aurantiaca TaxID=3129233 RepID=A0ABU8MT90_9PSEU
MSLASHLHRGALGDWFSDRVDPAPVVDRVGDALRGRVPLRPPRHARNSQPALVAGALRLRVGLAVQHAPPYSALLGAHRLGLADTRTVHAVAGRFPSHASLDPARRRVALRLRPTRSGWIEVGGIGSPPPAGPIDLRRRVVPDLASVLLNQLEPPGRIADRATETALAAACWAAVRWSLGGIALPDERSEQAAEVVDLLELISESGLLTRLHRWAGRPTGGCALGVADPVVVPGWASGGTLVGRGPGALLVEVSGHPDPMRRPDGLRRALHHLLARAWLDRVHGVHGIGHLGILFARHGVLVTADVAEFGPPPGEFVAAAHRVAAADGIRLRPPAVLEERAS